MKQKFLACLWITTIIALTDVLTKVMIQSYMTLGSSREVLGSFFKLTYILNQGGVFGSKLGSNYFYTVSAILVVMLVVYFLYKEFGKNKYVDLSLFIVLGGAVGNLVDRIRLGAVVDFLDFEFFNFNLLGYHFDRWPTFNVADVAVTVGMLLLICTVVFRLGRSSECEPKICHIPLDRKIAD